MRATRQRRIQPDWPYEIFGRELKARIERRGLKLRAVAQKAGTSESAIKTACIGIRPLSPAVLKKIIGLLVESGENSDFLLNLLIQICNPGISRTFFARGLVAPIKVGYLESFPFAFAR